MAKSRDLGLLEQCFIIPGVGPLASARTALWIRNNVPGINIPDTIIKRLESAKEPKQEGREICVELIQQIREIEGVSGVHVMAYRQEEAVGEIIQQSGVLDGRVPWYPGCELQSNTA
jgi:methylenetetrahydrofolate reductase (NADPH)